MRLPEEQPCLAPSVPCPFCGQIEPRSLRPRVQFISVRRAGLMNRLGLSGQSILRCFRIGRPGRRSRQGNSFVIHRSILPLHKVPPNLPPEWEGVFIALVEPLKLIHNLFFTPSVFRCSDEELRRHYLELGSADANARRMLDQIDGVAPQTWEAGFRARIT